MLSFKSLAAAATTAAIVLALSVKAEDYRFEITAPANMSMALFEEAALAGLNGIAAMAGSADIYSYIAACYGFPLARTSGAYNIHHNPSVYFNPGDYQGKNNETMALAYCLYYNEYNHPVQYTVGVAQLLGGNTTTNCTHVTCPFQYQADGAYYMGEKYYPPMEGYTHMNYSTWTPYSASNCDNPPSK